MMENAIPTHDGLAAAAVAFFAATMALAALGDARHLRIPNRLVVGLAAGAPALHIAAGGDAVAIAAAGLSGAALFLAGIPLFRAGLMGGGDVKLAAAVGLWLGPVASIRFIGLTALAGALLALGMLAHRRLAPAGAEGANGTAMPYGVAIAVGALAAFAESRIGALR